MTIFHPNYVFTFLFTWIEFNGYIRRTLDSPFLILKIVVAVTKPYGKIQSRRMIEIWRAGKFRPTAS